ncbi:MAG: hypothetical protein EPN20_00845 [Magnetospirillum sp.]|nr:MAG: hypothetical protein EPN20_00845 [Magnetospirillum sp.]
MDLNAPLGQFLGQIRQGDIRNLPDTQQHIRTMIAQFTAPITALPLWRHRPTRQILRHITYRRTHRDIEDTGRLSARMAGQNISRNTITQIYG